MKKPFFESVTPTTILSFGFDSAPVPLQDLNVLIGPNGAGKSNLVDLFELLRATPGDLAGFVRQGGGAAELIWKGPLAPHPVADMLRDSLTDETGTGRTARIGVSLSGISPKMDLRYRLEMAAVSSRLEIVDEAVEETEPRTVGEPDVHFYYRFQKGHPAIRMREPGTGGDVRRELKRQDLDPQQSVLSQRRDPDLYPEITALAQIFSRITTFRDWTFGRSVSVRSPQPTDLPTDTLLPDLRNLALVLNDLEHSDRWKTFKAHLRRFLPRFANLSTRIQAGHAQVYLHEEGLQAPIPASRLSDGTIRFVALLAILMRPEAASLICIEEPELGLHPDAMSILAPLLIEASRYTQVVVTTHSDALVSALTEAPDAVIVVEHFPEGTRCRRLEVDKLRFWLKKYRLGDIWRLGELGGNP